jgi:hypothetical protein
VPVTAPDDGDLTALLDFARLLTDLGPAEGASALPLASAACLAGTAIVAQVAQRRARLSQVAADEPALAGFLDELGLVADDAERRARDGYRRNGWDFAADLPAGQRVLSPSDFGFHNAVRRPDGGLAFVDFEYFGWDDPAKMAADAVLHPGTDMAPDQRDRLARGFRRIHGTADRFDLLFPLFSLNWCLILLNEFLPERWSRRHFAGRHADRADATRTQLGKARRRLDAVATLLGR